MAESIVKRRKTDEENDAAVVTDSNCICMMSSLPDSVLCHILSFLPTKTSVATMTLVSRRWRNLWKHLQVFNFDDESSDSKCYCEHSQLFKSFGLFVNAVLSLRKSRDIRKLYLKCGISDDDMFLANCIDMWLHAATGPHLQELSLTISNCRSTNLLLPTSLFNSTNLVSLCLDGAIHMKVQESLVYFPSLKMLKINDIILDSVVSLLSRCPMLETFDINFFTQSFINHVPPSSKSLKFTNDDFAWTYIEIDSMYPGRTTLGILDNLQSVVESYLDVFSPRESKFVDPILYLLRDKDIYGERETYIRLCRSTSKWSLHSPVINYPEFCNLHHLKLILPCFKSNLLLNVLEKCHMLQILIIQSNKEEPSPLRTWESQSTTVPKCLESHLTYIHIEGYQGWEDELTFAEYVLQNGLVLQTMLIFVDNSMDLTTVPKCLESHLTYIHIEVYQGWEDELTFAEYVLQNGLVLQTMLIFVDNSMDLTKKYCSLKRLS